MKFARTLLATSLLASACATTNAQKEDNTRVSKAERLTIEKLYPIIKLYAQQNKVFTTEGVQGDFYELRFENNQEYITLSIDDWTDGRRSVRVYGMIDEKAVGYIFRSEQPDQALRPIHSVGSKSLETILEIIADGIKKHEKQREEGIKRIREKRGIIIEEYKVPEKEYYGDCKN